MGRKEETDHPVPHPPVRTTSIQGGKIQRRVSGYSSAKT